DFGTGYSSLSYLKKLPISKVKIDQSFIHDLTTNRDSASIAQAIINLSHCLNMEVVAEGVENRSQLLLLEESGCDIIQGFLLSHPLQTSQLKQFLAAKPSALPPTLEKEPQ
ncbi:MAG TPA: hypothetical protein DHW71_07200, partial [Gammaproteobacteria bacterium]|nr:hypothetical protein [Gammaproteobacteria bacterium]